MAKISVAIVTWNRAKLLDQTLTQMHRLRIPADVEWELLVVVSCEEESDVVIERHKTTLPIRRVLEPKAGLGNARNRAVIEARGDLILWADDDVLVDTEWLAAYHDAAQRWPDAGYFGGVTDPWFECPPPAWILENLDLLHGVLALRDFGRAERYLADGETLYTANMATRADVFKNARFEPSLGGTMRRGYHGEDSELIRSLRLQGIAGVWVPAARAQHFIIRRRLNRGYVWRHFHRYGQTLAYLEGVPEGGKTLGGAPRWLVRQAVEAWIASVWARLLRRPDWLKAYSFAATTWGRVAEARRQLAEARLPGLKSRPAEGAAREHSAATPQPSA